MFTAKIQSFQNMESYHKTALPLIILFFLTLIITSNFHEIGGYGVETDFYGGYAINVQNMLEGGQYFDEDHGPGYIFFLIFFHLIFGDTFTAGKFLTIISSVLFAYFSFTVLKDLFNSKLAFFTTLLLAIIIFPYSILASTDMFFSFLIALATYLFFRTGKLTMGNIFWGGLVTGYAIMTRLNAIILPIAIVFSIIIINPGKWQWKDKIKGCLILAVTIFVTASPWFIMNMIYYGKPFVSEAHQTIGASFLAGGDTGTGDFSWGAEKEMIAKEYNSLFSMIMKNFPAFVKFVLKNTILYFKWMLLFLVQFPGYLFVVPGAALMFARSNKIQLSYYLIPLFGFLIYTIVSFIPRFYIYVLVFFLFFIVYFLFYEDFFPDNKIYSKNFSYISKILFIFVLLFTTKESLKDMKTNITNEPVHLTKIASIIKKDCQTNDKILARKPHLGYFSGLKTELIPDTNEIEALLNYARERDATYIFYGIKETELRPGLKFLQNPQYVSSYLQLIYTQEEPKVFLYKIKSNFE